MKMKMIIGLMLIVPVFKALASDHGSNPSHSLCPAIHFQNDTKILFQHGSVLIVNRHRHRDAVEITEDNHLIVNGHFVQTDDRQQELTRQYFDLAESVYSDAKKIGVEGAHVGLHGAKFGIQAAAGVFRLLLPDYDSEDFERDMEREKSKLETKAKGLEEKADQIERDVDSLESLHRELKKSIPELEGLDWF